MFKKIIPILFVICVYSQANAQDSLSSQLKNATAAPRDTITIAAKISEDYPVESKETLSEFFPIIPATIMPSILAIVLLIVLLFKNKANKKKIRSIESDQDIKIDRAVNEVKNEFIRERKDLKNEIRNKEAMISDLESQISVEKRKRHNTEDVVQSNYKLKQVEPINKGYNTNIKYAKYADLGDGFTASDLLSEENNESVFEITIQSPASATFVVSDNINAQKYALTNANYFLSKACKYDSHPFGKIINDKPGILRLQGGKWQIIEPIEISFK